MVLDISDYVYKKPCVSFLPIAEKLVLLQLKQRYISGINAHAGFTYYVHKYESSDFNEYLFKSTIDKKIKVK